MLSDAFLIAGHFYHDVFFLHLQVGWRWYANEIFSWSFFGHQVVARSPSKQIHQLVFMICGATLWLVNFGSSFLYASIPAKSRYGVFRKFSYRNLRWPSRKSCQSQKQHPSKALLSLGIHSVHQASHWYSLWHDITLLHRSVHNDPLPAWTPEVNPETASIAALMDVTGDNPSQMVFWSCDYEFFVFHQDTKWRARRLEMCNCLEMWPDEWQASDFDFWTLHRVLKEIRWCFGHMVILMVSNHYNGAFRSGFVVF